MMHDAWSVTFERSPVVPELFSMSSETPSHVAPIAFRGVYEADPNRPPPVPCGASAVEIKDRTGEVIGYAWLSAHHDAKELDKAAWDLLDRVDSFIPSPASGPRLTLHRDEA